MLDAGPPGWLRSWATSLLASTVYASVGVSMGGILYLVAPYFGGQPWGWFFAGTCIPPGIMALINTSDWMFHRRLRNLKRLLDDGLISQELYEQDRERAMEWRADRLYGKAPASSPTKPRPSATSSPKPKPVTKKRDKPAILSQPGGKPPAEIPRPEGQPEAQHEAT